MMFQSETQSPSIKPKKQKNETSTINENEYPNDSQNTDQMISNHDIENLKCDMLAEIFCQYESKFGVNFDYQDANKKDILHFQKKTRVEKNYQKFQSFKGPRNDSLGGAFMFDSNLFQTQKHKKKPIFNRDPLKILDAPGLVDNFYYNVTTFARNNRLLVSLGSDLHLFDYKTNQTDKILNLSSGIDITSLSNHNEIDIFAVGNIMGEVLLMDLETQKTMRRLNGENDDQRIVSTCFKGYIFGHGTRNGEVILYDIRSKDQGVAHFECHDQEVCALKFSNFSGHIFATGGNDNKVVLYDLRKMKQLNKSSFHKAAVKALSFSKTKENEMMTGGGCGDQTLCRWDISKMKLLQSQDLQSQICNLDITDDNYVITAHGWPKNQIEIRKADTMELLANFLGHSQRVLNLSMSDDGNMIVTGSGDQTLRFWNVRDLADSETETQYTNLSKFESSLR